MTEEHGGHRPPDVPDHPEPDPRLQGFPPPPPPPSAGYPTGGSPARGLPDRRTSRLPATRCQRRTRTHQQGPVLYAPARPPALPLEPSRYNQLLRGPRYRWWKPLLAILLGLALVVGFSLITLVPPLVVGLVTGVPDLGGYIFRTLTDVDNLGPVGFVALNLSLVILIPAVMLSTWLVHGVRPRFVTSVAGGLRWRWMRTCLLVVVPVWVVYVGITLVAGPTGGERPPQWIALLVIVVLMTPFQAAGEEYLFRGWILQNIGAWFARPVVGLVVATVLSTVLFSAAHGSPDIWVLGSIGCLAVAGCLATWRTGGLEAAIAMHAVNNILAFVVTIVFGGWDDAFIGGDTKGTVVQFVLSLAVHAVALALIWWQAGRQGLPYLSRPSLSGPASVLSAPLPGQAAPALPAADR